ncbi:MAG: hypothetical protein DMF52_11430 [Acidobacteria bacterium]|nr:MAG: hypothetical protein DMF52_11430 [Acidobacteriota bacterium]
MSVPAGAEVFRPDEMISHHILDSRTLELPFVGEVQLPVLHLGRYELPITKYVVMMWIASALILLVAWLATRRRSLAPRGVHNVLEAIVVFVRDELARKNIGPHGDRYVPYLLSTFTFILFCNMLGLVPYGATATSNISVTAGHIAVLSFFSLVFILKSVWVGVVLSLPLALFISGIEILVVFLQAYIFTMLTSLFIGMSVHPQH